MAAAIESLNWLVGNWSGNLGPMTVEETWYPPKHGSMQMMIRLSSPDSIQMLEFIVVREVTGKNGEKTLMLHLRQFGEAMDLRTNQEMLLETQSGHAVTFVADEGASVKQLDYTLTGDNQLKVDVTVATGDVVSAELNRS